MKTVSLYSIGHGSRRADEFIAQLKTAGVATLVDVRAHPTSTRCPQFSLESLRQTLEQEGIVYHWAGRQLGGFRQPRLDSPHSTLTAEGLRGFADHMESEAFQRGVSQLLSLGMKAPTAFMCAERRPEQCHRSLISDYLTLKGVDVGHLVTPTETRVHVLSPLARPESGKLIYDRQAP